MYKLFSKEIKNKRISYKFLGVKLSIPNPDYARSMKLESKKAIEIQDSWDLSELKNAKKLILFLTPGDLKVNGGVMSFFSLCKVSREYNPDSLCIISTYPYDKYIYALNDNFLNNEKIYRFSQIVDNCKNLESLILHLPEYICGEFYKRLSNKDRIFLKSVKNLQINILNQNIELMPEPDKIKGLFKLTDNITQTLAHRRYANQDVCNKWQIPSHLFLAKWDMSMYKKRTFAEKEKIIVLSPDYNKYKNDIVALIKNNFPDWEIVTVNNMSFHAYMDLISRAYFTITFGEGFDGYFSQPSIVGSVGIAVYNDNFFPDKSWLQFDNVFESYEDLKSNIVDLIKTNSQSEEKFVNLSQAYRKKLNELSCFDDYKDNIRRFYLKQYDFLPHKSVGNLR